MGSWIATATVSPVGTLERCLRTQRCSSVSCSVLRTRAARPRRWRPTGPTSTTRWSTWPSRSASSPPVAACQKTRARVRWRSWTRSIDCRSKTSPPITSTARSQNSGRAPTRVFRPIPSAAPRSAPPPPWRAGPRRSAASSRGRTRPSASPPTRLRCSVLRSDANACRARWNRPWPVARCRPRATTASGPNATR